jgi:hypothetical protein
LRRVPRSHAEGNPLRDGAADGLVEVVVGAPRLMFATDGPLTLWATKSIPAMTPAVVPLPFASSARTRDDVHARGQAER